MPPRGRPRFGVIFRSLFQPAEKRPYCFVSDGGHCENMGLVQLLRRRCRLIIVSDAACDPRHEFADLANALRVARMHGGVQVLALDPDRDCPDVVCLADLQLIGSKGSSTGQGDSKGNVQSHFVLARIKYPPRTRQYGDSQQPNNETVEDPDGLDGLLIYFKPSLTGDEDLDVVQYRSANAEFPHEPSNDQFFDAKQVEAYRRLGYHIAEKVQRLLPPLAAHDDEKLWNETWDGKGGEFLRNAFEHGWWQASSPRTNVIWTPAARNGGSNGGSALRAE
jgi:hypothetical protein